MPSHFAHSRHTHPLQQPPHPIPAPPLPPPCPQLAVEDHRWWWRSVMCGGSTALFIYAYCFYYWYARSDMNGERGGWTWTPGGKGWGDAGWGGDRVAHGAAMQERARWICRQMHGTDGTDGMRQVPPWRQGAPSSLLGCNCQ